MTTDLERRLIEAFHEDARRAWLTHLDGPAEAHLRMLPGPEDRRSGYRWMAAAACLALVVAGVVAVAQRPGGGPEPVSTLPPTTPSTVPTATAAPPAPGKPFVGAWSSTDTDGSSQMMEIVRADADQFEVIVRDDAATGACAGSAWTMTGAGLLVTDERLVIAQPELTCDDGTTPSLGSPPQAELANFTFEHDPAADELTDSFGVVWRREGSSVGPDEPATSVPTSNEMWPQSTLEEVQAAQELADAGDPAATWQLEPELVNEEFDEPGQVELVERFLREVLGWEAYRFYPAEAGRARNGEYVDLVDQRYLRCAPDRTNRLYPPGPDPERGEQCAPTIDDLTYETVSLDLVQLDRRGADGIWVVNRWETTAPFAQADPVAVEAQGRERLDAFLTARITGEGAEGLVELGQDVVDVPLLYATTAGAPYERYEIERAEGPRWPDALMTFSARLFTDGDTTVVEQEIRWHPSGGLRMDDDATTENGQPLVLPYTSTDGEVTVSAPSTWSTWLPGKDAGKGGHEQALDVWFGALWRPDEFFGSGERIELVDPVAYDSWCAASGGSPLLTAPADADAIAQQLIADPDFETTAPVAARIGGLEAVTIDVSLVPGGEACGVGMIEISRWIHGLEWETGARLRLYLVDLPDGMSVDTLAITVVAPKERFDEVIAETKPIIDSIEFHPSQRD